MAVIVHWYVIFKLILVTDVLGTSEEIALQLMNALWRQVNIDLLNGLVRSGSETLPEPILIKFYDTMWCHQASMS